MILKQELFYFSLALVTLFASCKSSKIPTATEHVQMDEVLVKPVKLEEYRESRRRDIDIRHTKLELAFDWDSSHVIGKATLWIKPYFYSLDKIALDAKGFQINKVGQLLNGEYSDLQFEYLNDEISIELKTALLASDSIAIYIDYVAKPDERELNGSSAISSDKGLYFINPKGEDPKKPRQLWTQGETEANSCWFPTVDSPNEKFTTEIYLTIEQQQISISNGLKIFSMNNDNGSKTDYWKMDQPHSAYLVMLAIGEFSEYEDKWGDMQVNYYLDSTHLVYAKDIFGKTPEMLQFYSDYLKTPYPWQKYDQVIVHDYVSGAMENTTAVIHGEFVQQTRREMLDYDAEDVIAHELFHHWFGDLVTCESWSNLTLNEGFATYGEYLWSEYKYSRDEADQGLRYDLLSYLNESKYSNKDLIRFAYDDKEDMFDSHSYSKGGRIIHMLRKEVGDKAFRESLRKYLSDNAYGSVEIHDLRLAFESVTGRDLNWFFNQWFLASGHPVIDVNYEYSEQDQELQVITEQLQDLDKYPLYRLPVDLLIQQNSESIIERIEISKVIDTFKINLTQQPSFVNFDLGENFLLEKTTNQKPEQWIQQYKMSELAIDRSEALLALKNDMSEMTFKFSVEALKDTFWACRSIALDYIETYAAEADASAAFEPIVSMAEKEEDNSVRSSAIEVLVSNFQDSSLMTLYKNGLRDSSYLVLATSFYALCDLDKFEGMRIASELENESNGNLVLTIAELYASEGDERHHQFYINAFDKLSSYSKYELMVMYGEYLKNQDDSLMHRALPILREYSIESEAWWMRMAGIGVSMESHARLVEKAKSLEQALSEMKDDNPNLDVQKKRKDDNALALVEIDQLWKEITDNETNPRLMSIIREYNESGQIPQE